MLPQERTFRRQDTLFPGDNWRKEIIYNLTDLQEVQEPKAHVLKPGDQRAVAVLSTLKGPTEFLLSCKY